MNKIIEETNVGRKPEVKMAEDLEKKIDSKNSIHEKMPVVKIEPYSWASSEYVKYVCVFYRLKMDCTK